MQHRTWLGVAVFVFLCVASGCDGAETSSSPTGATAVLGAACTEADFNANTKPCSASGDTVLECYGLGSDPSVPPYTWNLDKDCKADGKICVSGTCAATL